MYISYISLYIYIYICIIYIGHKMFPTFLSAAPVLPLVRRGGGGSDWHGGEALKTIAPPGRGPRAAEGLRGEVVQTSWDIVYKGTIIGI
jgi:hypothetical protein